MKKSPLATSNSKRPFVDLNIPPQKGVSVRGSRGRDKENKMVGRKENAAGAPPPQKASISPKERSKPVFAPLSLNSTSTMHAELESSAHASSEKDTAQELSSSASSSLPSSLAQATTKANRKTSKGKKKQHFQSLPVVTPAQQLLVLDTTSVGYIATAGNNRGKNDGEDKKFKQDPTLLTPAAQSRSSNQSARKSPSLKFEELTGGVLARLQFYSKSKRRAKTNMTLKVVTGEETMRFPERFDAMVSEASANDSNALKWTHDGEAVAMNSNEHKGELEQFLMTYFNHTKITSFRRQLSKYGWKKHRHGQFKGSYHNPLFHRDRSGSDNLSLIQIKATQMTSPNSDASVATKIPSPPPKSEGTPKRIIRISLPPTKTSGNPVSKRDATSMSSENKQQATPKHKKPKIEPNTSSIADEASPSLALSAVHPICTQKAPIQSQFSSPSCDIQRAALSVYNGHEDALDKLSSDLFLGLQDPGRHWKPESEDGNGVLSYSNQTPIPHRLNFLVSGNTPMGWQEYQLSVQASLRNALSASDNLEQSHDSHQNSRTHSPASPEKISYNTGVGLTQRPSAEDFAKLLVGTSLSSHSPMSSHKICTFLDREKEIIRQMESNVREVTPNCGRVQTFFSTGSVTTSPVDKAANHEPFFADDAFFFGEVNDLMHIDSNDLDASLLPSPMETTAVCERRARIEFLQRSQKEPATGPSLSATVSVPLPTPALTPAYFPGQDYYQHSSHETHEYHPPSHQFHVMNPQQHILRSREHNSYLNLHNHSQGEQERGRLHDRTYWGSFQSYEEPLSPPQKFSTAFLSFHTVSGTAEAEDGRIDANQLAVNE